MFGAIAAFELRYQLRSPVFLIGALLFLLFAFGATASDNVQIGGVGSMHMNSPYVIIQTLAIMNVIGIFLVAAFVSGAILRDEETGFAPLLRATRIGKSAYLWGRFSGAFLVALTALAAVPLGVLLGSFMPWMDAEKLGPTVLWHYGYAMLVFGLPTLLFTSSILFALATVTRNMMWTYVGAAAMLTLYLVSRLWLRDQALDTLSSLSDPFGVAALVKVTKYWTTAERNTLLPALEGMLLWNRLLWCGVALVLMGLTQLLFRMEPRERSSPAKATAAVADETRSAAPARRVHAPAPAQVSAWAQFLAIARFDAAGVFRSPVFFVLLALGVLNSFGNMRFASQIYGVDIYPVTRAMIPALLGSFEIIPLLIAIFYAGELVWRDRQLRMHEIVDATPAPDWTQLLPKIGAIVGVLLFTLLVSVITAMLWQASQGYFRFEIAHYLLWLVLPQLISATQIAVLAVFVQTVVPNKQIGWAVLLVYVIASITLAALGYEHNLYNYANTPQVPLSDINGQGHFWIGRAWFQVYWSAVAVALVVLSQLLRARDAESTLRARLAAIRPRLRGAPVYWLMIACLVWAASGAWIFYNTNVLNQYLTRDDTERRQADYERTLLPFESLPQPKIREIELDVAIHPHERRIATRGSYLIENPHAAVLDVVHVAWAQPLELVEFSLESAAVERDFGRQHYRIYRLARPLAPGEKRRVQFVTQWHDRGFGNGAGQTRIVANGTFVDNTEIAPRFGPDRDNLLKDRSKRKKFGLPPQLRMPKLEDDAALARHYLDADADWVSARIRLSTDADQVPVAPGQLITDRVVEGRRVIETRSEVPVHGFFSLQSARYAERHQRHKDIELAVYYQPEHEWNVDRMLDAMADATDLYGEIFSPYQFRYARVIEFPAYESFAQAFSGTMPYSEAIGFILHHTDESKIDMVTYVTAHEVAHQWWGHQLVGADMQGSTLLSETFAQYSALLLMERRYGKEHIRRFLKYELDRYLRERGGELVEELPLSRVENQPYIHYRKGSLVMYWLKEVVGEEAVNRALRRLLERYAFRAAPYARSSDFLALLREEAGSRHEQLISDLFERITLLDARADSASVKRRADGRWELSLKLTARKLVADGKGEEHEEPLDEDIDIGAFSAEPGDKDFSAKDVILMERRRIHSGEQNIVLVLDREPSHAGIDPYNMRIDRNSEDNLVKVGAPAP